MSPCEKKVDWRHFNQVHDAISEYGFKSRKPNSDWNELSLIKSCIWWKLKVHATGGPSDHSYVVSTHKLPNKKLCTERVDCFLIDVLLSEIVNKFLASIMLAAMFSSVKS